MTELPLEFIVRFTMRPDERRRIILGDRRSVIGDSWIQFSSRVVSAITLKCGTFGLFCAFAKAGSCVPITTVGMSFATVRCHGSPN